MVAIMTLFDLLSQLYAANPKRVRLRWTRLLTRRFFSLGYAFSVFVLVLGAFCLMVDLGRPERFYYVLTHPTVSVLAFGSYVLSATIACAAVLGAIAFFKVQKIPLWALRLFEVLAVSVSSGTMVYTGLLLVEISFVPLWDNPLLPVLFTLSALSVGMALVIACLFVTFQGIQRTKLMRKASFFDGALVVLEVISLGAYIAVAMFSIESAAASASFSEFFTGVNAAEFWIGFVVCGLVVPLVLDAVYAKINNTALMATVVPLVLIGGFYLRYCMVNVGVA